MYITILVLPVLASILASVKGSSGIKGPVWSVFTMKIASVLGLIAVYEVGIQGSPVHIEVGNWLDFMNIK